MNAFLIELLNENFGGIFAFIIILLMTASIWATRITMKINHLEEEFKEIKAEFKEMKLRMDKMERMLNLIMVNMRIHYEEGEAQ